MEVWEYTVVAAYWDETAWQISIFQTGKPLDKRTYAGGPWVLAVLNELGRDGWELVDRSATGTGGQPNVNSWQFILKRSAGNNNQR
jgi:hypothetical protein